MKSIPVFFFKEGIKFRLSDKDKLRNWIFKKLKLERIELINLNFIFCTDIYLRKINKEYLGHDYYTDIITFDNSGLKKMTDGDIYISIDRVRINSKVYKNSFNDELHRVMAHGVLHLMGYDDKNKNQKMEMKKMENKWLIDRKF